MFSLTADILIVVVALLHFWIMILEMFLWTKPIGMKAFRMNAEKAQSTAVLAANQGLYNGFLAAGLVFALCTGDLRIKAFFLICVAIAGIYGAITVGKKILFIQAFPALLALTALFLS